MFIRALVLSLALLLALPGLSDHAGAASGRQLDAFGCYQDRRDHRYRCVEGIAAGMSFENQAAMIRFIHENRALPGVTQEKRRPVETIKGVVARVYQVDKLEVRAEGMTMTVSLHGVDVPPEDTPVGKEALEVSRATLVGKKVFLEKTKERGERRMEAVVGLAGSQTLQEMLLENGFAKLSPGACQHRLCDQWTRVEEGARASARGLWATGSDAPQESETPQKSDAPENR